MTALDVLVVSSSDRERALIGGWAGIAALPACETCDGKRTVLWWHLGDDRQGSTVPCPDCSDGTRTPGRVAIVAPCEACDGKRCAGCEIVGAATVHPWMKCDRCEGGGMLLYGVAEVTEALPVLHGRNDHPTRYVGVTPERCVWVRPEDDYLTVDTDARSVDPDTLNDIPADRRLGIFAPGGVALHLGPARLVTDPGGCPACDGRGDEPIEGSVSTARCRVCHGVNHFLAPWAAPGLPSTPGLHRWEGA